MNAACFPETMFGLSRNKVLTICKSKVKGLIKNNMIKTCLITTILSVPGL